MAYRVRWSPRAADDLETIAEYISLDSPVYAKSVVKTIVEITRKSSQFPFAGRIVPEFNDENMREWFAYSYRIILPNRSKRPYHCRNSSRSAHVDYGLERPSHGIPPEYTVETHVG